MPQYRIEISPNSRAGCHETLCKKEAVKIQKGEIRFGSWVEIQDHGSWSWKHWGCVSGFQIAGLQELCGEDSDNYDLNAIDGYDEIADDDVKEKIRRCIEQGHIDPEDFKGDPEKNKLGEKGIYLTAKQKAAKEKAAAEAASADEAPAEKAGKRGRKKAANDVDDGAKAKKGRKPKNVEADEEEPKAEVKAKSKAKAKSASEGDAEEPAPPKKLAKRGPKAKPVKSEEDTVDEEESQEKADVAPAKAARGRKAAASKAKTETETPDEDEAAEKAAPAAAPRGRKRASLSRSDDKEEEAAKPAAKRGRKASVPATKAAPEDEEAKTAPKARGRGRPRKSDVAAN